MSAMDFLRFVTCKTPAYNKDAHFDMIMLCNRDLMIMLTQIHVEISELTLLSNSALALLALSYHIWKGRNGKTGLNHYYPVLYCDYVPSSCF